MPSPRTARVGHISRTGRIGLSLILVASLGTTATAGADAAAGDDTPAQATTLLDLSGLAPLGPGRMLAVHDAKNPGENDRPRASILSLTDSPTGLTWQPIEIDWPAELGAANDLEGASAIPGESIVILAESGDDASDFQRLFFVDVVVTEDGTANATLTGVADWPVPAFNVESVAVAALGDDDVLLWAERAEGRPTTAIQWSPLTYTTHEIGEPMSVPFTSPAVRGPDDRPISAMEVGPDGRIYVASAYDTGDDDGPFSSAVWVAGWIESGPDGPSVVVPPEPELLATVDGFKVESLALVEGTDGTTRLYAGTDDEDFGGVLRPLPLDR